MVFSSMRVLVPHYAVICEYWRVAEVQRILAYVAQRPAKRMLIAGDFNAVAPGDRVMVEALPLRFRLLLALQGRHIFRWSNVQRADIDRFIGAFIGRFSQEIFVTTADFSAGAQ